MKIGFFDNLANNAYRMTKIFRKQGYDAELLLDGSDTFPMSQPIWEDCDLIIHTDLMRNAILNHQYWEKKIFELGWERPPWIKETHWKRRRQIPLELLRHPRKGYYLIKTIIQQRSLFIFLFGEIENAMKSYDVVIAFGLGPIYANSAGIPFMHYPYGGDLSIVPFQGNIVGLLQRKALEKAKYILIGDPTFYEFVNKLGIESKAVFVPLIIDPDIYRPVPKNGAINTLEPDLFYRIQNRFVFFVPSRQDFYWKGSDKILFAFSKLVRKRSDVFMILSGWGNDLQKSKKMISELNLSDHIFFLPYIMSKKRLIKFYSFVDVVMDQFNLGAYGTATMEAMACGKPVIMDLDFDRYAPYFKELPPVLRAKSVDDIFSQMESLAENKGDIYGQIGRRSREWIMEYHGIKDNFHKLIKLCQECMHEPK